MKHEPKCVCESCLIHKWKTATEERVLAGKNYRKFRKKQTKDAYKCYQVYMGLRKLI